MYNITDEERNFFKSWPLSRLEDVQVVFQRTLKNTDLDPFRRNTFEVSSAKLAILIEERKASEVTQ
jgi:hypothetical protein